MSSPAHAIGTQRLFINAASEEIGLALMARIDEIQTRRIAPIIERVLDECSMPGMHIELSRLQIDLGTISFSQIEETIEERLRRELRLSISNALRAVGENPHSPDRVSTVAASLLDLLEHYLLHGTVPFWAPEKRLFSFESLLLERMEQDPASLSRMLRQHNARSTVLERLVLQLGRPALARVLETLEPESAALILAYLIDLRALHRNEPLVAMDETVFDRVSWLLTLYYVLRDPGTQFNRKTYVLSLIHGLAESEGILVADLLEALRLGLRVTEKHLPLCSSLPAVLGEILADFDRRTKPNVHNGLVALPEEDPTRQHRGWDILERVLLYGTRHSWALDDAETTLEALVLQLLESDPGRTAHLIRRHGRHRDVLNRIIVELSETSLHRLLNALDPESAAVIVAYLIDLREVHRAQPVITVDEEVFGRRLWSLTLGYIVRDPGTQFNRKSFAKSLLMSMATAESLDYGELLWQVCMGLEKTADRRPLDSGLPDILRELIEELTRENFEVWDLARGGDPLSRFLSRTNVPMVNDPTVQEVVLAFLRGENLLPGSGLSEELLLEALRSMLDDPTPELAAFLAHHAANAAIRERWSKVLPETILARVSAVLAPRNHQTLVESAELLTSAWNAAAPPGSGALRDKAEFWSALLAIFSRYAGVDLSIERLALELFQYFAMRLPIGTAHERGVLDLGQNFLLQAERLSGNGGHAALGAVLQHKKTALLAPFTSAAANAPAKDQPTAPRPPEQPRRLDADKPIRGKTAFRFGDPEKEVNMIDEPIFIHNAGLVLTAPFLPHLFGMLDLLGHDDKGAVCLRDQDAASRAVHLLQYLVDGKTDAPEPTLVLAKLLCGVPIAAAITREIEITDAERAACEGLMRSMIAHWTIISNTSIAGLRETFLQREGKLFHDDARWLLRVDRKTLDVLVDQIPWSISVIYHRWMSEPLHVTW